MKKIYLAIPYSGMAESSYHQANKFAAAVMNMGYNPFSPITHSHPLTKFGVPGDWEFWKRIDLDWIDVCEEVWVLIPLEGEGKVKKSTGVQSELAYALENNKPVRYFTFNGGQLIETTKQYTS